MARSRHRPVAVLMSGCLALSACSGGAHIPKTAATPPATRVAPVTELLHGTQILDNYRWLEGDDSDPSHPGKMTAEVSAWTDAQNGYTRSILEQLPGRQALEARFKRLMKTGSVSAPIVRANRYFFAMATAVQDQPIVYCREGYLGADTPLIDPVNLDASGLTAVTWFSPSEDGKLLAYGTSHAGDPGPILHLLDVDTAKRLVLEIPNVPQGVQWLPDGSGFFYESLTSAKDMASRQGLFHQMVDQPAADMLLFRQVVHKQVQDLPANWGPFGSLSRDGRWLMLGYWRGDGSNDLWLANFDEVRKTRKVAAKVVTIGVAGQASGTVVAGTLYLHTTKGAPNGRIVAVDAARPEEARWRDVVAQRTDALVENVTFGRGRMAVTYRKDASDVVDVFDLNGKAFGTLNQPGLGVAGLVAEEGRTEAFLTFTSFNYPATVFRVDLSDPTAAARLWIAPDVPVDPSAVHVDQVSYPSKDGTRITMFLAHKPGLPRTGVTPTLLLGYGGFGASLTPTFSPTFFQWFEAGGTLAVPNLRGGGEYGEAWHLAGMLDKKQHAFDDLIAAAEWLASNKYTSPQRLAIYGGLHGGLLAGAVLTQRPELFRVAVARLPVLDMLRYEVFPIGRAWVPEYGSVQDAAQFRTLLAYSPYQHVHPGTKYPAVLLTALEDDSTMPAMHARKMAAVLQAATTSDSADRPILLRVDRKAHQDPEALLEFQLRDVVDQRLFIMWQLGML